jgi:AbrB family looped-hinge helix DNA binding protein
MAYEVKVTGQGQTTIPKPLREKYAIYEGDMITYVDLGDHIAVLPVPNIQSRFSRVSGLT